MIRCDNEQITFDIEDADDVKLMNVILEIEKETKKTDKSEIKVNFLKSHVQQEILNKYPELDKYLFIFDTKKRKIITLNRKGLI